jgi:hypothetical protein
MNHLVIFIWQCGRCSLKCKEPDDALKMPMMNHLVIFTLVVWALLIEKGDMFGAFCWQVLYFGRTWKVTGQGGCD